MSSDAMMREAAEGQMSFFRRYLYPVLMAIVFLAGILAAARLGILLADRQVPPGLAGNVYQIKAGSSWAISPAVVFTVSEHLKGLREHDFRSSGAGSASVEGVSLFEVSGTGLGLEILAGSDRRYLKAQVRDGEHDGEIFWLMAREFREIATAKRP